MSACAHPRVRGGVCDDCGAVRVGERPGPLWLRTGPHCVVRRDAVYGVDYQVAQSRSSGQRVAVLALQLTTQEQAWIVTRGWEDRVLADLGVELDAPEPHERAIARPLDEDLS